MILGYEGAIVWFGKAKIFGSDLKIMNIRVVGTTFLTHVFNMIRLGIITIHGKNRFGLILSVFQLEQKIIIKREELHITYLYIHSNELKKGPHYGLISTAVFIFH